MTKRYNNHYPSSEKINEFRESGEHLFKSWINSGILVSTIEERKNNAFAVKFQFNLTNANEILRNIIHEITENRSILHRFSHDMEGNRLPNFVIDSQYSAFTEKDTSKPLGYKEISENKQAMNECMRDCFKELIWSDYCALLQEKQTIAKIADSSNISPNQAAAAYFDAKTKKDKVKDIQNSPSLVDLLKANIAKITERSAGSPTPIMGV